MAGRIDQALVDKIALSAEAAADRANRAAPPGTPMIWPQLPNNPAPLPPAVSTQ
jgi:hypothetical protein